jgi:hypothetical protein
MAPGSRWVFGVSVCTCCPAANRGSMTSNPIAVVRANILFRRVYGELTEAQAGLGGLGSRIIFR